VNASRAEIKLEFGLRLKKGEVCLDVKYQLVLCFLLDVMTSQIGIGVPRHMGGVKLHLGSSSLFRQLILFFP